MSKAAYKISVLLSTDGSTFDEFDGINTVTVNTERDSLEVTDFASASGARERIMGLKSYGVSLGGHYKGTGTQADFRAVLDAGAHDDNCTVRVLWDGTNGIDIPVIPTSYDVSGELDGTVEFSAECESDGVPSAV